MAEPRHIIITGGSSGIGKAVAMRYASEGDHVSILARRPGGLDAARNEIDTARGAAGGRTLTFVADVADRAALTTAIEDAIAQAGPPAVLITSAGMAVPGYFADMPLAVFEAHMAVNYFGTLYAIAAVLPAMRARGRGHLVLVSSGAALVGVLGYGAYGPSKAAIKGLGETLRAELKADGIAVSIVYPPDTDTPMLTAENRVKPPETKRITSSAATWSAADVARTIHLGVAKRRVVITPGWEMTALARFGSLIRPLLDWHFDRLARTARKSHTRAQDGTRDPR